MTLALKTLGAKMVSPMQCRVITEVMPNWRALWRQRMRWQRGALENIGAYGLTRATLRYWLQQIGDRLRDDRAERLPAADADHAARRRQLPVRLVLGRHRAHLRGRARGHRLGGGLARQAARVSRWSSRSATTSCSRPSTSSRCSTSPPAGRPAGTTSPARWLPAGGPPVTVLGGILLPRTSCTRVVPGPRHVRRDQHPRLRRAEPREAHPAAACVSASARTWARVIGGFQPPTERRRPPQSEGEGRNHDGFHAAGCHLAGGSRIKRRTNSMHAAGLAWNHQADRRLRFSSDWGYFASRRAEYHRGLRRKESRHADVRDE